jgi:hypothetical protein
MGKGEGRHFYGCASDELRNAPSIVSHASERKRQLVTVVVGLVRFISGASHIDENLKLLRRTLNA